MDLVLLGGELGAPNLGVSALGESALSLIRGVCPESQVRVNRSSFDAPHALRFGRPGEDSLFLHASSRLRDRCGTRFVSTVAGLSRWIDMDRLRGIRMWSPTVERILSADVIADLSAGDSFSDIYPNSQFLAQVRFKRMALGLGKPLFLMPQTIGPFLSPWARRQAIAILDRAALVMTREQGGIDELDELLGGRINDARFVECPDLAFTLDPVEVGEGVEPAFNGIDGSPVGVNVSGLLYASSQAFGLKADYARFVHELIAWLIEYEERTVVLVPHVYSDAAEPTASDADRSDTLACERVVTHFAGRFGDRLRIVEGRYLPSQVKSLIGRCDFFVAARMHAGIGAVSQAVPTAVLAYSKKVRGVMELAGVPEGVVDARELSFEGCLDAVQTIYGGREALRPKWRAAIANAKLRVTQCFQHQFLNAIRRYAEPAPDDIDYDRLRDPDGQVFANDRQVASHPGADVGLGV